MKEEIWGMKCDGGGGDGYYPMPQPQEPVEEEPTKKKKRKRPSLLTQEEGLLTGQGVGKALIGGKNE